MTLRFAAARSAAHSPLARALSRRPVDGSANDNCCETDDRLLHAALRHFAAHGMHAAREARAQAEQAFFAGDRAGYDWWLGVCRTLDRRLAQTIERNVARRDTTTGA
jgi:hypothetical protein